MGPADSRRITRAPRYSGAVSPRRPRFAYGSLTLYGPAFQRGSATLAASARRRSYNPGRGRTDRPGLGSCAFARHYLRNHCYFLFLRVLRCFSSPGSPTASMRCDGITSIGFPHSDIRGSRGICPSPRLFAACHVLLRLREPQASPMRPFSLSLVSSNGSLSAQPPDGGPRRGRAFSTLVVVARFLFQLDFSLRFRDTQSAYRGGASRSLLFAFPTCQ